MVATLCHRVAAGAGLCVSLVASGNARAEADTKPRASAEAATPATPATPVTPVTSEATKEAGERYARGLTLYGDGEFLLALVEFERAYQLSQNYKVLYNIGQVRIQLGRYAKGREALEEYLKLGGSSVSAERAQAVNKDLSMLTERTATLRIVSNEAGADIALDGKSIGTSPLDAPLVVDAGEHNLTLHKPGFYDKSQSVTLAGREQIDLRIDLAAQVAVAGPKVVVERHTVAANKPSRTGVWVGWATTGTLAVSAGVIGYFGVSKANELQSMRTDYGVTRSQLDSAQSSARTLLMISDITAGLAVVAGGVSLYMTLAGSSERPAERPKASPSVALGVFPGGMRLKGEF